MGWPSREMETFLGSEGVEKDIIDITAEFISHEVYETYCEYQVMKQLIERGYYSPERARQTYERVSLPDPYWQGVLRGLITHFDTIYKQRG